jgi:hypothetical protein
LQRYLEELESKLRGQQKLQCRIQELESKLLELEPSGQLLSRTPNIHHSLTPPETSNPSMQSLTYSPPNIEYGKEFPISPQYASYSRTSGLGVGGSNANAPFPTLEDNDPDTNPGVFEADEAGKGWYLGCASGSILN